MQQPNGRLDLVHESQLTAEQRAVDDFSTGFVSRSYDTPYLQQRQRAKNRYSTGDSKWWVRTPCFDFHVWPSKSEIFGFGQGEMYGPTSRIESRDMLSRSLRASTR